jgi:hypothetical protein
MRWYGVVARPKRALACGAVSRLAARCLARRIPLRARRSVPNPVEPVGRHRRIDDRVLNMPMAEVVL